ncbi:MAG: hypothetical protein KAT25_07000 [Sulfuriflexus sp.]|nr:hypothetical protein [Sulfuriflexus sp.]
MSSKPFDKALHLEPKASRTFAALLLALHIIAGLSVAVVIPVIGFTLLLFIPVLVYSGYYYFRKCILLSANSSVIKISQSTDGDWSLILHDQSKHYVDLCDDSYVHPLLVILNFKIEGSSYRRISLPLFRDALGEEAHRQLRCRLRLSKPAEPEKLLRR